MASAWGSSFAAAKELDFGKRAHIPLAMEGRPLETPEHQLPTGTLIAGDRCPHTEARRGGIHMMSDQSPPLPGHSGRRLSKAPEVKQALAAAQEYAILAAATTKRAQERE